MKVTSTGISFRETMSGSFALNAVDPRDGADKGKAAGHTLTMNAAILIRDLDAFIKNPEHAGELVGSITFPPLGENLPAKGEKFNLFSPAGDPDLKLMICEMAFVSGGDDYYVAGKKEVRDDPGLDLWADTTTLFTRLHKGKDDSGPVVGAGILRLGVVDLVKLLSTVTVPGAESIGARAAAVGAFGRFFLGQLWDRYARASRRAKRGVTPVNSRKAGDGAVTGDSDAPRRVGLDPQPMVDWFSPQELMRAGVKAVLAATFGNYADKREVQAALFPGSATVSRDYSTEKDLWFDYAADMGDGFNPTYAVNWLMAQPALNVHPISGSKATNIVTLPAGKFLVLGGDQVYPLPTREEYRRRMVDPCAMAFRTGRAGLPDAEAPDLFVLPGNHDWYDGLTSFIRLFCQSRALGPLQTRQQRSYFVIRLPGDWWLWGVDVQLEADLDDPQKKFFGEILDQMKKVSERRTPRVIVCTGQPSWVHCGSGSAHRDTMRATPEDHNTLSYLERLIANGGAHVALTISGDLHHYSHYMPKSPAAPHRITAGGGGAYFYPTHHLPERLEVPTASKDELWRRKTENEKQTEAYTLTNVHPQPEVSRGLGWGVLKLPRNNKKFAFFLGGLYLLFTWVIQSASKAANGAFAFLTPDQGSLLADAINKPTTSLMGVLSVLDIGQIGDAWSACWHVMRHSPATVSIASLVVFSLLKYRAADRVEGQWWGALHGVGHVLLSLGLIWFFSVLNLRWMHLNIDGIPQVFIFSFEMLFAGGMAGGLLFAFYLWLSARYTGVHMNDVYSSQAIQDHKNFVRFHIKPDGSLKLYPIAVPVVPKDDGWRVTNETGLAPASGEIRTELIGNAPVPFLSTRGPRPASGP